MTLAARPILAGSALAAVGVLLVTLGAEARTLWTLPAVALVLLGLHYQARWPARLRAAYVVGVALCGAAFSVRTVERIARNLRRVPEWDYLGFWLHARTAVLGRNFYDPANAQALALPYDVSASFRQEIVDVGFWYPPPSMYLFLPLGWLEPQDALPLWYAFHAAVLVAAILLLWRTFLPATGAPGLAACAALALIVDGTYTTFQFSQTSFVALLAVLLFWRRRNAGTGGAWLPVAAFVKPFLVALAAGAILGRKWRALAGMALSAAGLLLASAVAFGADTFVDYFTRNQVAAKPAWIYDEPTNQSLLGLVLRTTETTCSGISCITNPIFLAGAAGLALLTLWLGLGLERMGEEEWALTLYLLLSLIVYPVSQLFYSVLLTPVLLLAWRYRERVRGGAWTLSIVAATVLALAALGRGRNTILAFLSLFTVMAVVGRGLVRGGGWPLRASAAPSDGTGGD